jgi:hypothetical protein
MLQNPYCGFYTIHKFWAHDDAVPGLGYRIEQSAIRPDQTLCLVEINLAAFAHGQISRDALSRVERIFAFFASRDREIVARFLYDWDGRGPEREPKELSTVLGHMRQLAPVLKEHSKSVYIHQGLLVGSWGEMHASRHLSEDSLRALAACMLESTGEETFVAVRCPSHYRVIARSFRPAEGARLALFNDAILASETDYGTYGDAPRGAGSSYGDKFFREEELAFQAELCRFAPNGGEVLNPSNRNDFREARKTLARMRVSYLNGDYDGAVLDKWRAGVVRARGAWNGRSQFDYIAAHLGYRFLVEDVRAGLAVGKAGILRFRARVYNAGFAPCYRPLEVALVATETSGGPAFAAPIEADARLWQPDTPAELRAEADITAWPEGEYRLELRLHDPATGKAVRLANAEALGTIRLGSR